jgi:hypothetical protein
LNLSVQKKVTKVVRPVIANYKPVLVEGISLPRAPALNRHGRKGDFVGWGRDKVLPSVLDDRGGWVLWVVPEV